jgi:predicted DCC family thiol-disulfide oxidoreductase YuxK/ketosteroid isomerase-like protein
MNRDAAIALLDRLHAAQNEFYAGGSGAALKELLASSITWTVPGDNCIAGTYRGLGDVLEYFRRRRDLADRTFRMKRRDVLVGDGDRIAALTDGFATVRDVDHRWSTVGLYHVIDQRITACWLLPLDQRAFDSIWSGERPSDLGNHRWTVLYDAGCGFCKWLLSVLLRWDRAARLHPIALQRSDADDLLEELTPAERMATWHLISPTGERRSGGAAVAPLLRLLPGGGLPAAAIAHFPGLTDRGYQWVAEHRSQLSKGIRARALRRGRKSSRGRDHRELRRRRGVVHVRQ